MPAYYWVGVYSCGAKQVYGRWGETNLHRDSARYTLHAYSPDAIETVLATQPPQWKECCHTKLHKCVWRSVASRAAYSCLLRNDVMVLFQTGKRLNESSYSQSLGDFWNDNHDTFCSKGNTLKSRSPLLQKECLLRALCHGLWL